MPTGQKRKYVGHKNREREIGVKNNRFIVMYMNMSMEMWINI